MNTEPAKILVVRRDNIGDLVCTTPLFSALRVRFPRAYIAALVTRYNQDVLAGNRDIDAVFSYTKAKHLEPGEGRLRNYLQRMRLMVALRRERFDLCVLAAPGYQRRCISIARWVRAREVVGFVEQGLACSSVITRAVSWSYDAALTETEDVWRLAAPLGIGGTPGPLHAPPSSNGLKHVKELEGQLKASGGRAVGIHLSARKPSQRWPAERFVEFMRRLREVRQCTFVLLWSPGSDDDPRHPGDDKKASLVIAQSQGINLIPVPTRELDHLIAAISLCDDFVCADGGAMHIAAAAGKPIICMFGQSNAIRWRPWGVPFRLLQPPSNDVIDISVESVVDAYEDLLAQVCAPTP